MARATMHLEGCHFFAWVFENPEGGQEVRFYERTGDDLSMHGDFDDCPRCTALYNGAHAREETQTIYDFPDGAKEAFVAVVTAIAEIEERG